MLREEFLKGQRQYHPARALCWCAVLCVCVCERALSACVYVSGCVFMCGAQLGVSMCNAACECVRACASYVLCVCVKALARFSRVWLCARAFGSGKYTTPRRRRTNVSCVCVRRHRDIARVFNVKNEGLSFKKAIFLSSFHYH